MSTVVVWPTFAMKDEPNVKLVVVPPNSARSFVEPTCTPLTNTLPLSRPEPEDDVSAVTFKLSTFTSSPLAIILKAPHLTLEAPRATAAVGESAARVTEGADVEIELMVAEVALRAEKVELSAVARTGWFKSVS